MSKIQLPCTVMDDLLPLYLDNLLSTSTKELVQEHLSQCNLCREKYQRMTRTEEELVVLQSQQAVGEIDYLKTIKRRERMKNVLLVMAILLLGMTLTLVKIFFWGSPVEEYVAEIRIQDEETIVEGMFTGSAMVYSHYRLEEDEGSQQLVIYGSLASMFNRDGSFQLVIEQGDVPVIAGQQVALPSGTVISKLAYQLYQDRNPYIGNMSANSRLAGHLDWAEHLGAATNELKTSQQPYRWTFNFVEAVPAAGEERFLVTLENYACVLLALVDNCDEIGWCYQVTGEERTGYIDAAAASARLGQDIKAYGQSPEQVQQLLDNLGIRQSI